MPPLVLVRWLDHCDPEGPVWWTLDDIAEAKPAVMESVGWLVHEDDDVFRLSWSRATDGSLWSRPSVIIRACVVTITVLIPGVRSL
jgi:hypothetical protein